MNKQDAATFLEVSVRALERYTSEGRIATKYVKGKTRSVADYEQEELERFKAELETPVERPALSTEPRQTALARLDEVPPYSSSANFFTLTPDQLELLLKRATASPNVEDSHLVSLPGIRAKLLLSLPEAQALTGLSRSTLKAAIDEGKLRAKMDGRKWRLLPSDLEKWVGERMNP